MGRAPAFAKATADRQDDTRDAMKKTKAIVLAAGMGTRMNSDVPKVLHSVGGEPMLGKVLCSLKEAGIDDIVVVIGHKPELIKKAFQGKAHFVEQKKLLGSGDAVKCAVSAIKGTDGDVIVTCGDTPLITASVYRELLRRHRSQRASCTLLTCELEDPSSYGRIVRDESKKILKIVEEKDATGDEKKIQEINVGTYCFNAQILREYIHGITVNKKKKEFYLTDIVQILRENGNKITSGGCSPCEAIGVNSRKDLAMVNKILNEQKLCGLMESGVSVVDPGNTYVAGDAEIGRDTVIFPNTVIEENVKIGARCKIGPFARIRPGSRIDENVEIGNFVEICRTEIGSGSRVKHHTYLGDAVLGREVNIGAGTITANYDGEKKHRTLIGDGAFIGVGATLVAPIKIGKKAKVGAGSVVTKNKDVPDGATVIGVPAKPFKKRGNDHG